MMIKKIIFIILTTKIIFKKPKKTKILLFDKITEDFFLESKIKYKYKILDTRLETINFWIFIKTLSNFKFSFKYYCIFYIQACNPKLLITTADNVALFYQLKKYFKDTKFISIQNGYRFRYQRNFKNFSKLVKEGHDLSSDFIFLFGKSIANFYKKFLKFKPVILGSYRNNCVKISKKNMIKNGILYISGWRKKKSWFDPVLEKQIVSSIAKFCSKKKIKFYILPLSKNKGTKYSENVSEEYEFFKKSLKSTKFRFLNKMKSSDTYRIIDRFNLITFIDSTLGYESISRGKKIVSFSVRKCENNKLENFGFPEFKKKRGFFFTTERSEKEFSRILNNTWSISKGEWKRKYLKKLNKIMVYNSQNKKILNTINKILGK